MPTSQLIQKVAEPQHFVPPSARELRGQAVQRLQVGLFGLAAMLLLVSLANVIIQQVKLGDAARSVASGAPVASASANSDPLADIGVMPSADPSGRTARPRAAAPNR